MSDKLNWHLAKWSNLPRVLIDCSTTYEKINEEVKRHTYTNAKTVASTIATVRTAWVFVGEANKCLLKEYRVHCPDPDRAIDRVDEVFATLHAYAHSQQVKLVTNGWVVWVGLAPVMDEWEKKLR